MLALWRQCGRLSHRRRVDVVAVAGCIGERRALLELRLAVIDRLLSGRCAAWNFASDLSICRRSITTGRVTLPISKLHSGHADDLRVDLKASKAGMVRRQTLLDKRWAEDGCEGPSNVVAEGEAQCTSAFVRNPVALSFDGAACDGVG